LINKIIVIISLCFCSLAFGDWGTGNFISSNGYILTDAHVVTDDGHSYVQQYVLYKTAVLGYLKVPATVVKLDPMDDLALLKIDTFNHPCLQLAKYDAQFGLTYTVIQLNHYQSIKPYKFILTNANVTEALIISKASNSVWMGEHLMNYFYTKTIRPGNSGSGIVDYYGRIVGLVETGIVQADLMGGISNILINKFVPYATCDNPSFKLTDTAVLVEHD
jgi:S1-C subfamily serine protease